MTITKKHNLLLLFLVAGAMLLRLFQFPKVPFSLFADEVDIGYQVLSFRETAKDYYGNLLPLQFRSFSDVRTSLPIYATILVSYLPGVSLELAVRLTPLLFSFGSLFLIYFFMNSLWEVFKLEKPKGPFLPGHFAVFILALTPWHFTYSRTGFELSQLLFANLLGFYLFFRYLKSHRGLTLICSLLVLGLTPMIYSTAKLAVIGYPLVLWLFSDPGGRKQLWQRWYLGLLVFIPLAVLLVSGGAGQRFSEIAIFTDPTTSTEVDFQRQLDLGYEKAIGSSPSLITKLVHNKATFVLRRFINNALTPISAGFLFIAGDPNLRHALPNWGMLLKTFLIPLSLGLFFLFSRPSAKLTIFLFLLTALAIIPSALTRDGADHSSRLFMLLLPLTILITMGWIYLGRYRLGILVLAIITLAESFFFFHDYFKHYPYEADVNFHYGMKEIVQMAKAESKVTVISPRYEPPLIFYLFYNHFPPEKFQSLMKEKKFYHEIGKDLNLEGYRIGDDPVYIAFVANQNAGNLYPVKGVFYITYLEAVAIYHDWQKQMTPVVRSPSGLPIFYRIEADKLVQ